MLIFHVPPEIQYMSVFLSIVPAFLGKRFAIRNFHTAHIPPPPPCMYHSNVTSSCMSAGN